jgi:hypothetical protein
VEVNGRGKDPPMKPSPLPHGKSSQFKNSFSIGLVSGTGRVAKGWSDWYWNLFYGYACMIPPECDALFMLALQAGGLD